MKPRNIIFIVADDMAPWVIGPGKHPAAVTPHLESLARDGVLFTKSFTATPVCSPARSCLLTGLYSTETGILDYLRKYEDSNLGLGSQTQTWVKELRKNGYRTALFGKWHLGEDDQFHPEKSGYDTFCGWRTSADVSKDPEIEVDGKIIRQAGFSADIITDYALDYMRSASDAPFLVSLHFWEPHCNVGVYTEDGDRTWHPLKDEDWSLFKDIDPSTPNPDYPKLDIPRIKRMTREYLASVHAVDRNIGRIVQALKELGIEEQTAVIFTSDNGYNLGHNGIWHKGNGWWILTDNRGNRPNMYDNSLRVPSVVKCPGLIEGNRVVDLPVSVLDWFPTVLRLSGIRPAAQVIIRGRDLVERLEPGSQDTEDGLFMQYSMWNWNQTGADLRAYRTREWKLILDFKNTVPHELYDLVNDPDETTNLYSSERDDIRKIRKLLQSKMVAEMEKYRDPALALNIPL